jgi:rod shape-determining protein MreD
MSKRDYKIAGLVWVLILILQSFTPAFKLNGISIQPDFLLVLITFIALRFSGDFTIIFGFSNGIIQDFTTQESLIGILTLAKSVSAYGLHFVQNYRTIWTREVKLLCIFSAYFIHNLIYYYFYLSGNVSLFSSGLFIIFIQSVVSFLIFIIFEKILFKSKLI